MIGVPSILGPDGRPVSAERVRMEKQTRFNPLRGWTPDVLVRQLEAYARGEIAHLSWVMEWLEKHDDILSCVAPKAKAAVSRWGYDVLPKNEIRPEQRQMAADQQGFMQEFYQALETGDGVELEEKGGMRLLVQQVMDGYGKGYAAHHVIWRPLGGGRLTVECVKVPTWFFEATEGRLRFLPSTAAQRGVDLDTLGGRQAWMVSKGRGVMLAGVLARMFKQLPLQDWLTYCDRHGMPAFLGKTTAPQGSQGWSDMASAVATMGAEWGAVINKDDVIDVLSLAGTGEVPYAKLVDRMDRALVMLWRGGDLSTMSRENGTGSNPQQEDSDELDADNAAWVSETLNRNLTARALAWKFGTAAPVLVELKLRTKTRVNLSAEIGVVEKARSMGVRVDKNWFLNKFGVVEADADSLALGEVPKTQDGKTQDARQEVAALNALQQYTDFNQFMDAVESRARDAKILERMRGALRDDLAPLGAALWSAYQESDPDAMRAALRTITETLPDLAGDADNLATALADQLTQDFLQQ